MLFRSVGIPGQFGASYIGLRALLQAAGVPESEIQLDSIGFNQVEALATGQEDAVVVYVNNEPLQLEAQGIPVRVLRVSDYVQLASNGIITSEATLDESPDLVRRFLEAVDRGLRDTLADPMAAYEISKAYVEGLEAVDSDVQRRVLETSISFWRAEQLGRSDPGAWENMVEVLISMDLLDESPDVSQAFSNEYLPGQ